MVGGTIIKCVKVSKIVVEWNGAVKESMNAFYIVAHANIFAAS